MSVYCRAVRLQPLSPLFPYTTLFRSQPATANASASAGTRRCAHARARRGAGRCAGRALRSEEHTSELQSQFHLVCRLLLEKKRESRAVRFENLDRSLPVWVLAALALV